MGIKGNIGAVILGAGAASRFGAPKQLLEIEGMTLLDRACRLARDAGCRSVLRVLGAHAEQILARPCPEGVLTTVHGSWETGMGSSLAEGVRALLGADPGLAGIFIILPDQPLATAELLERMGHRLDEPGVSIVLCEHEGITGPPALFASSHFHELRSLTGDRGAKSIAALHQASLTTVDFPGIGLDIDTPAVWQSFMGKAP